MGELVISSTVAKLAEALSKAQAEMQGAKKDSANPFFKSKYADLESVWEACREPLTKHGLSVVQIPVGATEGVGLTTVLMHTSGEYIGGTLVLHPKADDPQAMGSALTYGRRYSLAAISGVHQTDDDGEAAMNRDGNEAKDAGVKKPFSVNGTLSDVKKNGDRVFAKCDDHIVFSTVEHNQDKMLKFEGKDVELVLLDTGARKGGKKVCSIHMIAEAKFAEETA